MKHEILTKLLAALLVTAAVISASCSESVKTNDAETTAAQSAADESTQAETDAPLSRAETPDNLPDYLDFEGKTIRVICRKQSWFKGEIYVDELNGEVVNDAVYNRDVKVADRLNIGFAYTDKANVAGAAETSINAGADDYDIVVESAVELVQYSTKGQYYNLRGKLIDYLDLDAPWWAEYYTEQASVGDKLFFITGDAGWSLRKLAFVTYFNKAMVEDFNIENPYELVLNGTWTADSFARLTKQVYSDVNGDGKRDFNDIYGFGCGDCINFDVYWSAYDLTMTERDDENLPYLNVNTEKFSTAVEKTYALFYGNDGTLCVSSHDDDKEQDELAEKFTRDELLFTTLRLMGTDLMRDMESDYGIIPSPKFDEAQDNYYTYVHDQYSIFGIPITVPDTDPVTATLEAFAAESYRTVTPAYYDIVLKGKYLRDEESSVMLELALDNVKIDFAWIYCNNMSNAAQVIFRELISSKSTDFVSLYTKNEKTYRSDLDKLIQAYYKLDD